MDRYEEAKVKVLDMLNSDDENVRFKAMVLTFEMQEMEERKRFECMFDECLMHKPEDVPAVCPHTGLRFFAMVEDEEGMEVAVYGGPFDSYTIPFKNEDDDYWTRYHYDWDAGEWSAECIDVDGVDEED